ncbi:MAG: hypothetical protein V4570_04455 [Pseudomonadota bacterium]
MSPITTRIFLGFTLLLAVGTALFSLKGILVGQNEAWATLAAALAVITSMVSAWGAQRVVELEEARMRPFPYPQFDIKSRYGLILLKITNFGGGTAHDVRLIWDKPLKNSDGKSIYSSNSEDSQNLSVLMPNQHISKMVDGTVGFFSIPGLHLYSGLVEFKDGTGNKRSHKFHLDAECLKGSLLHDEESLKTHYELQKLPGELEKLRKSIDAVGNKISSHTAD